MEKAPYRVHVCCGPTCTRFNPKELLAALEDELRTLGIEDQVSIQLSACRNRCEQSPSVNVYPGPVFYNRLTPEAMRQIARQHLTGGGPVEEWRFRPGLKPTAPPRDASPAVPAKSQEGERKRRWWW